MSKKRERGGTTMNINVEYYGILGHVCGTRAEQLQDADIVTVGDAIDCLVRRHSGLEHHREHMAYAVGEELIQENTPLSDGCVLALLPPVSGG